MPRLVGAETAVRFIVANPMRQNRMLTGPEAFELGLRRPAARAGRVPRRVDRLRPVSSEPNGDSHSDSHSATEVIRKARGRLDGQVHGAAPAPYGALDLIEGALSGWSLEEGYAAEEEAVAELLPGRQAQASLYAFDLVERRAKRRARPPDAEPRPIRKVGIVGAGLMATQLATLFLRRLEVPVVLRDLERGGAGAARATIEEALADRSPRAATTRARRASSPRSSRARPARTTSPTATSCSRRSSRSSRSSSRSSPSCASTSAPDCVLATNTSSLSVDGDGRRRRHPLLQPGRGAAARRAGPHAGRPTTRRSRPPGPSPRACASAGARRATRPAFVVNRVLTRLMSVVLDALEHGNDVDETDEAILALGLPMAPSVLLQMVGPRVANHVLETLHDAYPDRFPLSPTLANYAEGKDEIVVREERAAAARGDPRGRARGARRRDPAPARGGRRRRGQGRRHRAAARRGLAVLARRDHEVPRPDRHLGEDVRASARRDRRGAPAA